MSALTVRCTVSGRVQGVFYRASTSERAAELGLSGWVRNLDDGRVELAVSGDAEAIEALVSWLWEGPPRADVTAVTVSECLDEIEPGFRVLG
jgi:acylphosphatase